MPSLPLKDWTSPLFTALILFACVPGCAGVRCQNSMPATGVRAMRGGEKTGTPSRAAHPSACSQPSRKLLMLSQPSSPPFALVVQTWVGPALCAPPFLEALFCARLHAQLTMSIQKHHSGDAQAASFGLSTAAAGVLLCAPDGSFLLVFGLSWLDFFARKKVSLVRLCFQPQLDGWECEWAAFQSQSFGLFFGSEARSCAEKLRSFSGCVCDTQHSRVKRHVRSTLY